MSYNSLPHRDEQCLNCVQHDYSNDKTMKFKLECRSQMSFDFEIRHFLPTCLLPQECQWLLTDQTAHCGIRLTAVNNDELQTLLIAEHEADRST